jgi:hypothetical protein
VKIVAGGWPARASAASCAVTAAVSWGQPMVSPGELCREETGRLRTSLTGRMGSRLATATPARDAASTVQRRTRGRRARAIHRPAARAPAASTAGAIPSA